MVRIQQVSSLMLEHTAVIVILLGVVDDVLCVRLFDPDEKHVFLNVGYIGGNGKICCFFPVSIEEI